MKDVDLGEPTSFFDHVYLGCAQRECRISRNIGRLLPVTEKSDGNISSWSYDMEGYAKKCVQRYCELVNKTTQQLYKAATPRIGDHTSSKRNKWDLWENCL